MKILHINKYEKSLSLIPETLDDFWHLTQVIEPGDTVKGSTDRKIKGKEGQETVRVKLFLELQVESVDFDKYADLLRINGIVLSGKPEDLAPVHSHHSLEVSLGERFTLIKKQFKQYQIDRLKKAEQAMHRKSILAIILDDERCDLFELKEFKAAHLVTFHSHKSGKQFEEEDWRKKFFADIEKKTLSLGCDLVVIAGPGFTKEDLLEYFQRSKPKIKFYLEGVSSSGDTGLQELLQGPALQKLTQDSQLALESKLMDQALKELGQQSGKVTYGLSQIKNAISIGAVENLLILDKFLVENRSHLEELMLKCENQNGRVHIFSHESDAGKKLEGLGGTLVILRYRIE